ncbi:hypothetical protein NQ314_007188 [Rhamnusium bicolor]|uniref:Flap endonuclease GEN n=1 Tax=Rhamnusium bicolor TaxID=1586634 RepID=A0AAV8YS60_9CUCU|nr:hypothetical protein NQ314_007188 [Rhamnusium bicolor]
MGIKHLWTILAPFCERKPLYEIQGKTVAVDLSCWICEAQNIAEYQVQPRMYLRNLYFRTCYLLLMEVNPIFVLEGKAPELKYQTIAARNDIQFKGAKPKTNSVKTGKDRTRFHFVLRQCEDMLRYMGLVCIKGKGEAESLCAYLNEAGLVDGCISQDSDCFAYGAKVVYRNFSISAQGSCAASGGAVDIYDITKAYKSLNFGRNKIIAMALLCGSDYNEGVQRIGKELVLKLFDQLSDEETLDRLRSWRSKQDVYEKFENQLNNKNICTSCGHQGRIQSHTKNGCNSCGTSKGCDSLKYKVERLSIKNEINIRTKALQDPNFPDENLIKEYLVKKDNILTLNLNEQKEEKITSIEDVNELMKNTSISEPAPKKTRCAKGIKKNGVGSEDINNKKPRKKSNKVEEDALKDLENSFSELKITSTPLKIIDKNNSFDLNMSNFGDEDDTDISHIVDSILSRKKPDYLEQNLRHINLDMFENDLPTNDPNTSSFFINTPVENDLFERSFGMVNDSGESTEECEFHEDDLLDKYEEEIKENKVESAVNDDECEETDDSFSEEYVPLYERLKKK